MLILNEYYLGATIRLQGAFSDLTSTPADPTGVSLLIKAPDGTITTLVYLTDSSLVRDDVGIYHVDFTANQDGCYCYRWEGSGAVSAVDERKFTVLPGCFQS